MSDINRFWNFSGCCLLILATAVQAQEPCPAGTLWEPYSEICAEVRDIQGEFLASCRCLRLPSVACTGTRVDECRNRLC